MSEICKKARRKVCALARVTSSMSLSKKRTVINAFFNSQFNYCLLIWMCHSSENSNKINRLHGRCFIIIYNDKRSSFNALLEKDKSVYKGTESLSFLGPKICDILPDTYKDLPDLNRLK